jgi:hypothetical protein
MTIAIPVSVRRIDPALDLEGDLRRARLLANWLDAKFELAGIKFGLDAIVGLVPVVGDALTAIAGLYPIHLAKKHGLGKTVISRMAANVLIDWAVGEIPVLGDLFDVQFKSNIRNVELLEKAIAQARAAR